MREVYQHIQGELDFINSLEEDSGHYIYHIKPKPFSAERVSAWGREALAFDQGGVYELKGASMTQRMPGMGRVFFYPYTVIVGQRPRFIEPKGYGQDGGHMNLFLHDDGDIHFGMFYKNAAKEYAILLKACQLGLRVPLPLLLGKISRATWLTNGLESAKSLAHLFCKSPEQLPTITAESNLQTIEHYLRQVFPYQKDPLNAFRQPYSAGIVIRAPLSPFRIGDPSERYAENAKNTWIARKCGQTFWKMVDLGYLHLSPGTGNWTTMAELTDMSDCYDLRKDRNLESVISSRENKVQADFWQDLIGERHTGNLSPYFIEGMLGDSASLEEAGMELAMKMQDTLSSLSCWPGKMGNININRMRLAPHGQAVQSTPEAP